MNPDYEQGVYYQALFEKLLELKKEGVDIESVTIWGLTDAGSWRREQTPVLFTGDLSAKLAFQGVVNAKKGGTIEKPADFVEPPKDSDPYDDDFEDGKYKGASRAGASLSVESAGAYEGNNCLKLAGATEVWDGYTFDATRFLGKIVKYRFAVKSTAAQVSFSADIADLWPHIQEVDTSSGDWVVIEGTMDLTSKTWKLATGNVEVPDLTALTLYFETQDCTDDLYIDSIHLEIAG